MTPELEAFVNAAEEVANKNVARYSSEAARDWNDAVGRLEAATALAMDSLWREEWYPEPPYEEGQETWEDHWYDG